VLAGHEQRCQARQRRVEERGRRAADHLQNDQLPQVRVTRDEQRSRRSLRRAADDVGPEHHRTA